ncbi:prephenate dehydratase [Halovulum dunhuangense]|uniref:prephenate dehydratase n=1 Tax=Halovulum dunhuangense TaxID=1505036 RepID=A0A849L5U7_9RHOB|nr:prephenate dehydratase [Halovulum dunhuangense]NNU81487.1 prephenate dehydratase [Halovulum dunhuangense]
MAETNTGGIISYQGEPGAYSHQACLEAVPDMEPMAATTFEGAIDLVRDGTARMAMIPVENSTYGRVADVHQLLPESGLHIVGEHFVRVHINLLGVPGATLGQVTRAESHPVLLGQCRGFLKEHGIARIAGYDTAGAAKHVREAGDPTLAALASPLAGRIYGLETLSSGIEDNKSNTTRFLLMAPQPTTIPSDVPSITTFLFRVRNIPAALYKAMGGFATNGVNMVKLESYMLNGSFTATQFYADIEGHPDDPAVARAMEELRYFTSYLKVLGTYPAALERKQGI